MIRFGCLLSMAILIALATPLPSQEKKGGGIVVDKDAKTVTIPVKVAPRVVLKEKKEPYPLEVVATWPHPKGKKSHETIVTFDESIKPSDVAKALESLNQKPGAPVMGAGEPKGPAIKIYFLVPDATGLEKKVTLDKAMIDPKNGKSFPAKAEWRFTGSVLKQLDPNKADKTYGADDSGTLIAIFPVTAETVFQSSLTIENEKFMKLEVNAKAMPKEGTAIKLVFEAK
jgi:hypothetical protein